MFAVAVWNVSSEDDFDNINHLATAADWRLVFDLNVLLRDTDNRWNSSNAHKLLRYAVKKKYDTNMDLELGNGEPQLLHTFSLIIIITDDKGLRQ